MACGFYVTRVSHRTGVESFKEAGLRGDKICAVSLKKGVERRSSLTLRGYFKGISHEMGVERPHRVSTPDTMGLYVSREKGVER
jgi:hypothetical protein